MVLFLIPFGSYSQSNNPLRVGDTIPSINLYHVFNQSGTTISLNDYKGKLIILDFWNRWCTACIQAFPQMEKLQKVFGDKIKILLVTNDKNEELVKLFKKVRLPALPIISDDSILNSLFPHTSVPHHVWINPAGQVQFITEGYNATEKNILKIIDGANLTLHSKKEVANFETDSALWKEGNGRLQKYITSYSFSMTKIDENEATRWSFIKDTINKTASFKFVNIPLLDLYKMAFGYSIYKTDYYYDNRIVFDLPEKSKYFKRPLMIDSLEDWEEKNLVCYESKWNLINDSLAYQFLQNDINRFFPYSVKVEQKEVKCYLLSTDKKFKISKTIGGEKAFDYSDTLFRLKNMPLSVLIESLNGLDLFESIPVVGTTNFSANIDVSLINAFKSLPALKKELLRNGFQLLKGKKKISMLVISKRK